MPIRMTDDNDSNEGYSGNQDEKRSSGGGSGFGGGGNIIAMLLPLILRYPKLIIPAVIIGGLFFMFKGGCSGGSSSSSTEQSASYGTGATLDPQVYDSTEVYAALSPDEQLPERVSLERFAPTPGARPQDARHDCGPLLRN